MAGMAAASEAMKMAVGIPSLAGKLLIADTLAMKFDVMTLAEDPACPVCHEH